MNYGIYPPQSMGGMGPQQMDQQNKAYQQHQEQCIQMQRALSTNPFPGPHTYISVPNAVTAFIVGINGERVKKLHQLTNAYIFVPKDFNALTDERVIEVSGNDKAVQQCQQEIKRIVKETAPLLGIDLEEFKAKKKVIEDNFRLLMKAQSQKAANSLHAPPKKKPLNADDDDIMLQESNKGIVSKIKSENITTQQQDSINSIFQNPFPQSAFDPEQQYLYGGQMAFKMMYSQQNQSYPQQQQTYGQYQQCTNPNSIGQQNQHAFIQQHQGSWANPHQNPQPSQSLLPSLLSQISQKQGLIDQSRAQPPVKHASLNEANLSQLPQSEPTFSGKVPQSPDASSCKTNNATPEQSNIAKGTFNMNSLTSLYQQ
ncbi:hypothetical protein FGO68_gene9849 [Halteria grandinella]|uniref:K Homology domain-containing protein n=1 Tax=Halteria grandinella TaxID=5974 RepID=A0A8J8P1J7_HALGN|nr:hypothetical protein FGO68_gene9849 [Halteria grandinella]